MTISKYSTPTDQTTTTTGTTTADVCGVGTVGNSSAGVYRGRVMARQQGSDDAKSWIVEFGFRRDSDGTLSITGNLATLLEVGTLGALTWTVQAVAVSGVVYMRVKGSTGDTVDWSALADAEWMTVT